MLSNLKVLQKLGVIGFLFLVAVLSAIYFYSSGVTDRVIAPADNELKGLALNLKVIDTQKKFAKFYLEVQKGVKNGSTDYQTAGEEALAAFEDLKTATAEAFGDDEAKGLLEPIAQMGYTEPFSKEAPKDDFKDIFDRSLPEFPNVARSIAQQSNVFQNDDPGAVQAANLSYNLILPLAADITGVQVHSMDGQGGGGDDDFGDDDDLDSDFEDLGEGGFGNELQTRMLLKSEQTAQAAARIAENELRSPFLKKAKTFAMPDAGNYNGDVVEGSTLSDQAYDFATSVHQELIKEAEARKSSAQAQLTFVVILAIIVGLVGAGAVFVVSRDIQLGITKALGVAEAIAGKGDLSQGLRYMNVRGDELGSLLNEMAKMCESLDSTAAAAESIASGDLVGASIAPRSEQDRMGKALQNMVDSLRDQIGQTKNNAASVAETAKNILAATSQVAATANQMATSISEATTTAEEVRQTANLAEQKAKSVAQSAGEAASVSVVGQRQTQMTLDEMDKIRGQMETIAESIVRLSEQGQAIGDIITTVNDIAEQSNVLAVNASIEAAKAGEHGRGFAVVAQEVKSLADESKTATSAIRAILSDIERATAAAVMLAEQGTKSAQASVDRSKEAGSSIKDLGTRVVQAAQSSAQISASASQQLAGVDQVVDAMISIKDGSSQIVDSVNMVKQAAEELSGLSATLETNIQTYKV